MSSNTFSRYLQKTRNISLASAIISVAASFTVIVFLTGQIHIASVIGTTAAATIAACATFARMHTRTQRYVRFAIRARLAKKAEPEYDRLMRNLQSQISNIQTTSHPSPEVSQALHDAESCMGIKPNSVLALVVPLELILGIPHNCPSAAAMLYANRHPVILIDNNLQLLLDNPDDLNANHDLVVSVLCHEIAHLIGWNTRWSKLINICELFVTTACMAALVAYSLEHNFLFGIIGTILASIHLASEPVLTSDNSSITIWAIIARLALIAWIPFVITGLITFALPLKLTIGVTILSLGLKVILAFIKRKQEIYADILAVKATGSSDAMTRFFRSLRSHDFTLWDLLFSSHPPINTRMKALLKIH